MNTLTFFFLQLLCLTMRHLHQPNHFFFLTLDTSSSWENHTSLLVHVLIIVFNIHESSLFITRSISSYIIAYQYVKHSSQQFMHVLLSITIFDLLQIEPLHVRIYTVLLALGTIVWNAKFGKFFHFEAIFSKTV